MTAAEFEFLQERVLNLERKMDVVLNKLQGSVSEAAIQRLLVLRQSEYQDLKDKIDELQSIISVLLNNP